jgi:uncharacterized protein (TIGR02598 family)
MEHYSFTPTKKLHLELKRRCKRRLSVTAFSLVEVVFAMSVMTFACTVLLGLLPSGIRTIHEAISTTVEAQIMQSIVNTAEIEAYPSNGVFTNSAGMAPAVYYFDDEGTLLGTTPTNYVYMAKVLTTSVSLPGNAGSAPTPIQMNSTGAEPGVASLLQVVITSINSPSTATTNTVVWPNSGS